MPCPTGSTEYANNTLGLVGSIFTNNEEISTTFLPDAFIQVQDLINVLGGGTVHYIRMRIGSMGQLRIGAGEKIDINSDVLGQVFVNNNLASAVYSSDSGAGIIAEALTAITGSAAHGSIMLNVVDTDYPSRYLTGIFHINGSSTHVYTVLSYDTLSVSAVNTSGTVAIAGGSGNYQYDCTYLGA